MLGPPSPLVTLVELFSPFRRSPHSIVPPNRRSKGPSLPNRRWISALRSLGGNPRRGKRAKMEWRGRTPLSSEASPLVYL